MIYFVFVQYHKPHGSEKHCFVATLVNLWGWAIWQKNESCTVYTFFFILITIFMIQFYFFFIYKKKQIIWLLQMWLLRSFQNKPQLEQQMNAFYSNTIKEKIVYILFLQSLPARPLQTMSCNSHRRLQACRGHCR